jgi:hypothetical protein
MADFWSPCAPSQDAWPSAVSAEAYVPREAPEADWAVLRPRVGEGPLSLIAKPSQQDGPRMRLDMYTDDQVRDVERILALGPPGRASPTARRYA